MARKADKQEPIPPSKQKLLRVSFMTFDSPDHRPCVRIITAYITLECPVCQTPLSFSRTVGLIESPGLKVERYHSPDDHAGSKRVCTGCGIQGWLTPGLLEQVETTMFSWANKHLTAERQELAARIKRMQEDPEIQQLSTLAKQEAERMRAK